MPTAAPPRSQATAGTSQATGQLTGEQMALILAMIAATSAAQDNLATRTVGAIQRLYSELLEGNGWFTQRRVDEIVRDVTEVMEDSLQAAGEITQGYLEGVLDVLDVDFDDIDITIDPAIRTGVTPEREWNRPAEQARISRLLGADEFQANEKALVRAEQQARMDLLLARQEAEKEMWGVSGDIVAYRRILHPELSQSGPCGLCIVAASRVYHKSDLRPLHNGCWCDVMPVVKTGSGEILDPGFDLNEDDLKALYGAEIRSGRLGPQTQSGTGRQGLQRVRLKHLQHAELGPVLVDGRYAIRKKADVVDLESKRMDPQRIYDAQVKIIADYERRVAAGQRPQFDIDFHRRIRDEYAKKLGIKADAA
jgi:hypothetical protein